AGLRRRAEGRLEHAARGRQVGGRGRADEPCRRLGGTRLVTRDSSMWRPGRAGERPVQIGLGDTMMQVGTVTVTGLDGSNNPVLGPGAGGMALAIYQAIAAEEDEDLQQVIVPTLGQTTTPYSAQRPASQADVDLARDMRLMLARRWASRARALAKGIVEYIKANAEVDLSPAYANVTSESL